MMFFAVIFILGGACALIWYVFSEQLTDFVRWVRWGELWAAKILVGDDHTIRSRDPGGNLNVAQWRAWLKEADVKVIEPVHIKVVTMLAVPPLRIPFAVCLGLMTLYIIFFGYGSQYKRKMDLEGLIREQSRSFPPIQPFIKFDPRKTSSRAPGMPVPAQLPLFAEALSPEEWLAFHEIPYTGGKVDRSKAWQALTLQLGKRWRGPDKLPIYAQGLYASFCLKAQRKRKDSEDLLNEMARSWTPEGGFNPSSKLRSRIRKVIADPKFGGSMRPHVDQHAWETTALLRALSRARSEGGVLAPAEFVWLRGADRALWYPLNNLGRKSFHAEASGALVHFTNELIAGQKIPTPRFEAVITVLEEFMKSTAARGVPELDKNAKPADFSGKKKRK